MGTQEAKVVQNLMIQAISFGAQRIASTLRSTRQKALGAASLLTVLVGGAVLSQPLSAQVPAVVGSSAVKLNPAGGTNSGRAVVDACGDVYVNQSNLGVIEIQAGTGTVTTLATNTNGYNNGAALAIDATKTNLYFPTPSQWYGSQFTRVPLTNCIPGGPQVFASNAGSLAGYYYGTAADIAADGSGNVFFTTTAGPNPRGQIIE